MLEVAKKLTVFLTALAMVALLGASAQAGAKVQLTFWTPYGGALQELYEKIAAEFSRTHPDMEARHLSVPWEGYFQKLATASLSRTAPEWVHLWGNQAITLADMGVALPLDDFLAEDKSVKKEDYYASRWAQFVWNGKVWGLSPGQQIALLYWNKDMFAAAGLDPEKPPSYFEEADAYASRMFKKDAAGKFTSVGFLPLWIWGGFVNYGSLWGGRFLDEKGNITAADPVNVEALQWAIDYYNKYGGVEVVNNFLEGFKGIAQGDFPWLKGQQGMAVNHQWVLNYTATYAPNINYGVGMPLVSRGPGHKGPLVGGDNDIMVKGSRHPKEGWELFKYFHGGEGEFMRHKSWTTASSNVKINSRLRGTLTGYWERPGMWDTFEKALTSGKPIPATPVMSFYEDRLGAEIDFALRGRKTAKDALMEVQRVVQAELDKKLKK